MASDGDDLEERVRQLEQRLQEARVKLAVNGRSQMNTMSVGDQCDKSMLRPTVFAEVRSAHSDVDRHWFPGGNRFVGLRFSADKREGQTADDWRKETLQRFSLSIRSLPEGVRWTTTGYPITSAFGTLIWQAYSEDVRAGAARSPEPSPVGYRHTAKAGVLGGGDTTTGLTVPVGIVKIPAGYKKMVKAQIHGEVATDVLLLFTPSLHVPDVLLPDLVL